MMRPWALFPLVLLLQASVPPSARAEGDAWIGSLGLRPGLPIVALPAAAGPIVGIIEVRKLDRYTQTVVLRGDPDVVGQNTVTATVTRDGLAPRIDQADIDAEMAELLPGIPMSLAPTPGRNSLGVFGFALGHRGTITCLYGWQSVNLADRWISGDDPGPFSERHALSLRVRLCRQGLTGSDLARLSTGLASTISGDAVAATALVMDDGAYDALAAAEATDGLAGSGYARAMVRGAVQVDRPRARRHRRRSVRPAEPASRVPAPMAGMPIVPLPE